MRRLFVMLVACCALAAVGLPAAAQAAPPSNDDFANATVVDPTHSLFTDTVVNTEATTEPGEPQSCASPRSVWYSVTPGSKETIRVGLAGSSFYDTEVSVYRQSGSDLSGLIPLGCATYYGNSFSFQAQAGTTYYIQAGDIYTGGGTLQLQLQTFPPPPNDDFAVATAIGSLPFSDNVDATAATFEPNEPTPSCVSYLQTGTAWYRFTPSESGSVSATGGYYNTVAAYRGSGLGDLNEIGCRNFGGVVTFHADAGTTYYFQLAGLYGNVSLQFQLVKAPPPVAALGYYPGDPSALDTVQFYDQSSDPAQVGFSNETWDFGDGTGATNPGCCPTHRYAADGTYKVKLAVTTADGRTASTTQSVQVKTHDVTIARVSVPQTGNVGQTRTITVGLTNSRYPETVQVQLLKSVAGGDWQQVGVLTQYVPVRGSNRTTDFGFNYTFAPEDATLGKVNFQAIATIQSARDALPTDNTFISLATKVAR
jgi:PKD repeat protein